MDDDYILMHGGTEEDIAQIAHDRGACNYAVNGSYCEICKKGAKMRLTIVAEGINDEGIRVLTKALKKLYTPYEERYMGYDKFEIKIGS